MTTTLDENNGSSKLFALAILGLIAGGLVLVVFAARGREGVPPQVALSEFAPAIEGVEEFATPAGVPFDPEFPELVVDGDPIPPLVDSATDEFIGQPFPTISSTNFEGEEVTIEADGRPKVIYYLAHGCPFCQAEVPEVIDIIDDGGLPEGLDIYGVVTLTNPQQGEYPPSQWLEAENWDFPVLLDDDVATAFNAAGSTGTPFIVALDGNNNIVRRVAGRIEGAENVISFWEEAAAAG